MKKGVKKSRIALIILIIIATIIVLCAIACLGIVFLLYASPYLIMGALAQMLYFFIQLTEVAPEIPEIQYAEFPFEIVYSIDGEVYEINDAYVCEYKGIDVKFEKKVLDWATYFKYSDAKYIELCDMHYGYRLCLYVGSPEYYMMESFPPYGDHVPGEYLHSSGNDRREEISFEEAKEKYGLEIISATFSEPIENEFEYRTIDKIRLFIYDTFGIPVD